MENKLKNDPFYNDMFSLISPLGLSVIETRIHRLQKGASVSIYISKDGDVNSDDLENVYNIVYVKLKANFGSLTLEVSTPGLARNIKDAGEFEFFKAKEVRIYSLKDNTWIKGIIFAVDDTSITLSNGIIESAKDNENPNFEKKIILFSDIKKARLIDATIKEKK